MGDCLRTAGSSCPRPSSSRRRLCLIASVCRCGRSTLLTWRRPVSVSRPFRPLLCRSPYTFKDSLKNPWVDTVVVFHDVGLDRLVNSYRNPAVVDRPVTYVSCPGTRHIMDLDNITNSVLVTAGGSLTLQNLAIQVRQQQTGAAEPDCSQRCNSRGHTCACNWGRACV